MFTRTLMCTYVVHSSSSPYLLYAFECGSSAHADVLAAAAIVMLCLQDKAGATINDVMVSLTVGTLRRHLAATKALPDGPLQVRALLPIALPRNIAPADKFKKGLENVWGFTTADMCASESDILKRLTAIEQVTAGLKGSYVPVIQLALQNGLLPLVPVAVCKQVCDDVFSRHSLVFSNVPGPPMPVIFAGQRVARCTLRDVACARQQSAQRQQYSDVLQRNVIVVLPADYTVLAGSIGILSYDGAISMNICGDAQLFDTPAMRKHMLAEITETCAALQYDAAAELEAIAAEVAALDAGNKPWLYFAGSVCVVTTHTRFDLAMCYNAYLAAEALRVVSFGSSS
eukprot:18552-Heterococcus_DN1.PRE.2